MRAVIMADDHVLTTIITPNADLIKMRQSPLYVAMLFKFFDDFQTRMTEAGRKGPARWALKQKSKYFRLMKGGEN